MPNAFEFPDLFFTIISLLVSAAAIAGFVIIVVANWKLIKYLNKKNGDDVKKHLP